jgi:hypothetical protein
MNRPQYEGDDNPRNNEGNLNKRTKSHQPASAQEQADALKKSNAQQTANALLMPWQAHMTSGIATEWTDVWMAGINKQISRLISKRNTQWAGTSCRVPRFILIICLDPNMGSGYGAASATWFWKYRVRIASIMIG